MGCKASKQQQGAVSNQQQQQQQQARKTTSGISVVSGGGASSLLKKRSQKGQQLHSEDVLKEPISAERPDRLFRLLLSAWHQCRERQPQQTNQLQVTLEFCLQHLHFQPQASEWKHSETETTPLHLACRLIPLTRLNTSQDNIDCRTLSQVLEALIKSHPNALISRDIYQHIPLHYALACSSSSSTSNSTALDNGVNNQFVGLTATGVYRARAHMLQQLLDGDTTPISKHYLQRNNVLFQEQQIMDISLSLDTYKVTASKTNPNAVDPNQLLQEGCTPLYHVLETLPDDFTDTNDLGSSQDTPTESYVRVLQQAFPYGAGTGNYGDQDKPLSLLYRRFTRQFDAAEQFFAGDNSRPEVVQHRRQYKQAAGNTWKLIELLLEPPLAEQEQHQIQQQQQHNSHSQHTHHSHYTNWGLVHRAVQVETPPDLLRYIVETNAQDLTRVDSHGNLPLHYAAKSKPPPVVTSTAPPSPSINGDDNDNDNDEEPNPAFHAKFPAFYTKYVVDELLYKFPEAASMKDAQGRYPLTLAIQSGKQWIGGGIQSLYQAYPQALEQINLDEHPSLTRALSLVDDDDDDDDDFNNDDDDDDSPSSAGKEINTKEQSPTSANGGSAKKKTMGGIVKDHHHDAIMLVQQTQDIAEVTTSMWAHEEDAGVQMLGCMAIAKLVYHYTKNSKDDILQMALTAVSAVVNACKAHPNEAIVQEKACLALLALAPSDGHREVHMVASGAIAAIIGAMQAHVGDVNVQEAACQAVAAIVQEGGADRATVVASVSGVTALLNALAAHASCEKAQVAGLVALVVLTQYPEANLPELPRQQTEPLLQSAKEDFPLSCAELVDILLARMTSDSGGSGSITSTVEEALSVRTSQQQQQQQPIGGPMPSF